MPSSLSLSFILSRSFFSLISFLRKHQCSNNHDRRKGIRHDQGWLGFLGWGKAFYKWKSRDPPKFKLILFYLCLCGQSFWRGLNMGWFFYGNLRLKFSMGNLKMLNVFAGYSGRGLKKRRRRKRESKWSEKQAHGRRRRSLLEQNWPIKANMTIWESKDFLVTQFERTMPNMSERRFSGIDFNETSQVPGEAHLFSLNCVWWCCWIWNRH